MTPDYKYAPKGDFSDNKFFAKQYSGIKRLQFWFKIWRGYMAADARLKKTLRLKKCYYGPFKGEFGHFLAHNLPFLSYLYSKGVQIYYCGMELHRPFLVDENGESIIAHYYPLRDFFGEVSPTSNNTVPPADVQAEISKFMETAEKDPSVPFWNIDDEFYYWFIQRNWLLKGPYMKTHNLEKVYGKGKEKAAVIFPRKKGTGYSNNHGGAWDYMDIARVVSPYFDKVYITGHPSLSAELKPEGNIEVCLSNNNKVILEICAKSQLIITQHSGVNNLGEYTNNKVLIIYNGKPPIGSLQNTLRFRPYIGTRHDLDYAFSKEEIIEYAKNFTFKPN
ncbi:MAG: hypothetical protein ACLQQ4_18305 [Bacteroidia bacterium]